VQKGRRVPLTWATCAIISMCFVGCAKAPTCKVSPVELEELREDISVLQKDLKNAKDREAQLTADLATKQADLAAKRPKPDELRAQLEQVKKGVGKTEKPKDAPKTPATKQPASAPGSAPAPAAKQPAPTPAPTKTPPAAKAPAPKDTTKTPPAAPKDTKAPASKDSTKTPPAAPKKGTP
jgi:septal ring factor EnvC (AmiA/AmiB activator)